MVLDTHVAEPVLKHGEAIVRPTLMGVCSTDLEVVRGLVLFSGVMGHECVGVVEKVTDMAHKHLQGSRVVVSMNVACGACDLCRKGLSTHCRARTVVGLFGRDGCFADRVALPARNLHLVPDGVSDDEAVFAESVAAAMHTKNVFRAEGRPYVTVLGDGKLGLLVVQVVAKLNASVRLIGKHPEKLDLCDRWGIKHRLIGEVGLRQDQDVVIDCTGSAAGLEMAMRMVRPRGKIVLKSAISPVPLAGNQTAANFGASHPAWREPINLAPLVINEIELVGSRCGSVPEALGALATKQIDVLPLITKRGKLADGVSLMAAAGKGQLKVLMAA